MMTSLFRFRSLSLSRSPFRSPLRFSSSPSFSFSFSYCSPPPLPNLANTSSFSSCSSPSSHPLSCSSSSSSSSFSSSSSSSSLPCSGSASAPSPSPYLVSLLSSSPPSHTLPGLLYSCPTVFASEVSLIWSREWVFVGHSFELPNPGDFITKQIATYQIIITRDFKGNINAFHNVCRHRGFKLVEAADYKSADDRSVQNQCSNSTADNCGHVRRRFVCPYHQWTYELDGKLSFAKDKPSSVDQPNFMSENSLLPVHIRSTGSYLFICLSAFSSPPPVDFDDFARTFTEYTAPFNFETGAKIAFKSTIVEKANWKLVWENNRECYHCKGSHPELGVTFPSDPSWNGVNLSADEAASKAEFEARAKRLGLPSTYEIEKRRAEWRIMRMAFIKQRRSMTLTGEPAVTKRLGSMPVDDDVGDVLCFHYPNTWNHFQADHALSFEIIPISPTETQLTTRWIVPKDAVEGKDYDLARLTEVWLATNAQDRFLVERQQAGVSSPAYKPGPYNLTHEDGVVQFNDWYRKTILQQF